VQLVHELAQLQVAPLVGEPRQSEANSTIRFICAVRADTVAIVAIVITILAVAPAAMDWVRGQRLARGVLPPATGEQ
jgi:hypothetical protein